VDANGKTTLNMEDYMKFRAEKKVEAEAKKKQTKAKKGAKGKMWASPKTKYYEDCGADSSTLLRKT